MPENNETTPSLEKDLVQSNTPKGDDKVQSNAPASEPTQEDLDWRADFGDELKTHKSLLKFKTTEDLAKGYLEAERKIGASIDQLDPKQTQEEVGKILSKTLNLDKADYKLEGIPTDTVEAGKSFGLKPEGVKKLIDIHNKAVSEQRVKDTEIQVDKWKREFSEGKDIKELNKNFDAGLKHLGITYEEYKNVFGDKAFKPELLGFVEKKGKSFRSEGLTKIQEGSATGGLPSSREELLALFDALTIKISESKQAKNLHDAQKFQAEQDKVTAKLMAVSKKQNTQVTFL